MEGTDIKCEVTFREGGEPLVIKEEPMEEGSEDSVPMPNPLMFQANQMYLQKIKLEPNSSVKLEPLASEEYLEGELKITQERKMRSQQFSANPIEGCEVFSCKMCKANYVSRQMLETHIQQSHTTGPGWIHCQLCEYKFRKVNKFNEHMIACHGQFKKLNNSVPEEHNCTLCDFKSSASFTLVTHMQKVHREKPDANGQFSCENCSFRASTINAIKSHRYLSHFQKNLEDADFDLTKLVSCVVCSIQLPNKELLKKHLLEKHNMSSEKKIEVKKTTISNKFKCPFCDLTFQYSRALEEHQKAHQKLKYSTQQNQLGQIPLSGVGLKVGSQNVKFSNVEPNPRSNGQPPLKKIKVNDLPSELTKMKPRIAISGNVDNVKPSDNKSSWFLCNICPFKTQKEIFFTEHMHKVHNKFGDLKEVKSDNSPWLLCTLCSFKTLKETIFIDHMHKDHNKFGDIEDAKKYSCRKCEGIFPTLLLFVSHKGKCKPTEAVDAGKKTKAFRCAICNERFLEALTMQKHVNSHTIKGPDGGKFYKCPCCEHVYKNPRLLVEHIKNNHRTDNIAEKADLESTNDKISNVEKDPLAIGKEPGVKDHPTSKEIKDKKCNVKQENSFEDDPEIKELDDILNSFNNENVENEILKERNKANIGSDDDGSDTSVDSDEETTKNEVKKKKTSFSCLYCHKGPKTTFQSKDSLMNHQKDIFGLKKNEKFFMRPHLNCPQCSFMIQCEVSMSQHLAEKHQVQDKKCDSCSFQTNMTAIMNHHITNNHKDNVIHRTCAVCGIVLRDKKNLTGHYFSKHNILDPSKFKNLQTP